MKKSFPLKPVSIALAGLILAYVVLGFFAVPAGVRKALDSLTQKELAATFFARSVRFNPFTLTCRIQDAGIKTDQEPPLFSVQSVLVDLSAASLFKLAPVVTALTIDSPRLALSLDQDGKPVLPGSLGKPGSQKKPENPKAVFGFSISNISLTHGRAEIRDPRFNQTHEIRELDLNIPKISTLGSEIDTPVQADASLSLNRAPVRIDLSGKVFGPKVAVQAGVSGSGMDLAPLLPYIPLPEKLALTSPGVLSWELTLGFAEGENGHQDSRSGQVISVTGSAGLKTLAVDLQGQGPLCRLPELSLKVDSPDLLKNGLRLTLVRVVQPEVFLVRDSSGLLPLEGLFKEPDNAGGPVTDSAAEPAIAPAVDQVTDQVVDPVADQGEKRGLMPIALDRLECKEGKVHIRDGAVEGEFSTLVAPVTIGVDGLKLQENKVDLSVTGRMATPAGETLSLSGRVNVEGGVTKMDGHLALENGSPSAYDVYLKPVLGAGPFFDKISAAGDFSLILDGDGVKGGVREASLDLSGLGLRAPDDKTPMVQVPGIEIRGIDVDLSEKTIRVVSLEADQGKVSLKINDQGEMNLIEQVKTIPSQNKAPAPQSDGSPWQVFAGKLGIKDWRLDFHDDSRGSEPVDLLVSDINVTAEQLSVSNNGQPGRIEASMGVQDSGRITLAGPVDLAGRKTRLKVGLEKIDIRAFQPYFTDYLNIEIGQGWAGAKAELDFEFPQGKEPVLKMTGEAGIGEFSSKDKITGNDFFRCKSFFVSGMDISLNPTRILVSDISLTDFYNRAVITESGQLNYRQILAGQIGKTDRQDSQGNESTGAKQDPALPPVSIENITLQGGHINFSDLFTQPNYTANMTQVGGSISNLSTTSAEPADVVLKGVHGLYSPLDITGKVIPFGTGRMADMTLSFKNIDLTQFNAYAQKYLGYEIESGKLILNLDYHIKGDTLASKNRLFFDQFDLGKKVDSQEATSLPIELAISLLKNSKNQIDLDIPVTGNLKDPQFSFGRVVATAFKNLILGVASAPFKLLGSLIGGWDAEELGYVAFDPGRDGLDDRSREKLESLASVLLQKEKLKFLISGRYDPNLDTQALRTAKYQAMILQAAGQTAEAEQKALMESLEEREALVSRLYAEASFPKPRDEQGREKEIQTAEQEKLLLTNTEVTLQELVDLADRRSKIIMSFLADQGLDPQRLFVQAPEAAKEEDQAGRKVKTVFKVE